ncbi:MAG: glutathione S-transferase family protein [Archangiaceae bacterium]|nr:glutathione S-transferase family protein [Archangiaceae bacterium]
MTKPTLTYFDIPTSRGEECRLALFIAGVPFTDERLTTEQWQARKASAPFGALPMFTVEGKPPLAQSNAILNMLGAQHGLLPSDAWEAARHQSVMMAVEELRGLLGPVNRIKDPEEKKKAREALAAGPVPDWAANIEKQIAGPYLGGAALSVADLKLFVLMGPLTTGKIDHIKPEIFARFPKLLALVDAVRQHPKVMAWQTR